MCPHSKLLNLKKILKLPLMNLSGKASEGIPHKSLRFFSETYDGPTDL